MEIFTDGACRGNPGPGGWGVLLRCDGVEKELYGGVADTTNNRMELQAAIEGLRALSRPWDRTSSRTARSSCETARVRSWQAPC